MSGTKEPGKTAARNMGAEVKCLLIGGPADHRNRRKRPGEEGLQAAVALQNAAVAGAEHIGQEPCKHDFVSDSLFSPDEQDAL